MNRRVAAVLRWGTAVALVGVVAGFAIYVTGLLPAHVAPPRLPGLLHAGADALVRAGHWPVRWAWLAEPGYGDSVALAALLALVAVVAAAYLALVPLLLRRRDWLYLALVVVQLAVFALAGSGWLGGP